MTLLEMRDAAFERAGETIVAPLTVMLESGERCARTFSNPREAASVALMAAGLVKASSGRVFVGQFDPRIQPTQAKRLVGFVPHDAVAHAFATLAGYIAYRAALWGLDYAKSIDLAAQLLDRLDGVHEAFAFPLAGALISRPALLVLDRPQGVYAPQILAVAGECAVFSTHVSERDAALFAQSVRLEVRSCSR